MEGPSEEPLGELDENIGNIDGWRVTHAECLDKLWILGNLATERSLQTTQHMIQV